MWLTRLALRNPILILMLSLMTIVLGLQSLGRLSVDLFPDITIPVVRVATFYTGAGPEDIEKSITVPIERAVSAAPGIDRVESVSKQGVSIVSAWFSYNTNLDNAQFEVSQRVAQILAPLRVADAFAFRLAEPGNQIVAQVASRLVIVGGDDDRRHLANVVPSFVDVGVRGRPGLRRGAARH